ncbi:FlgB family protein [Hyphococcus flavus]|uniref:FlgB family protein n=1 Tax=Hyphococcus flavus TaxID=1866326 RepID=A0AAF0CBQ1_9PROT|nr:FlgB family protein [Hyphococcus flavus]WDI31555.1 FlgB family protein [Hyphococcus flavus]
MFNDLKILHTASLLARHSVERHTQIAENIANADTPGYKAKDVEAFSEAFARNEQKIANGAASTAFRAERVEIPGISSPNGNTVSLEDQMSRSTAATRDHDTALTIYSKTLSMLRSGLGRR